MPLRQGWLMQHSHHCSSFSTSQLSGRPFRPALQLHPHRSVHFAAASRLRKDRDCPFAARAFPRPHHQNSQAVRCKASNGAAFDNSDHERPEQTATSSSSKSGYLRQQWSKYSQSFATLAASTKLQLSAVLNPKFMPMVLLFFFLSFINTLLDSLGSSLVITAVGGGTAVIPFLTVYAVWPASFIFLILYSMATQRFSRGTLFNIVIMTFMGWFVAFGLLYPSHETIHFHALAEDTLKTLPSGLAGAVGMVRNWMFTLFYVAAEMWGDVVLSLLFWGLANELTSIQEAPLLYPLFGVGANIGQTVSGKALSLFSAFAEHRLSYATQIQAIMVLVLVFSMVVLGLHMYITRRFPAIPAVSLPEETEEEEPQLASGQAQSSTTPRLSLAFGQEASSSPLEVTSSGANNGAGPGDISEAASDRRGSSSTASTSSVAGARSSKARGEKPSLREAFVFLTKSKQIRCLAVMALAQGLSTNLIEIAWKSHLHILHPSPAAYSAFLGEVATWTGIVTGTLMFASPALFARWKWRGVAGATPAFMLWTGVPFFVGCVLYNLAHPTQGVGTAALRALVIVGAILQVFAKGAKFSMFKPAEEMVYIGLDEQSRTKGKAAIDVAGAQTGKSMGSVLQQVLLVMSSGSLIKALPVMAVAYVAILRAWSRSVTHLATMHICAFTHAPEAEGIARKLAEEGIPSDAVIGELSPSGLTPKVNST